MSKKKTIILASAILLICLALIGILLDKKYATVGDCAEIVYYKPLTMWDRIVFAVIGIIGLSISLKLAKPKRVGTILLSGLYTAIIIAFSIFGNQLLEMRTEHWPHEYHPQPIENKIEKYFSDTIDVTTPLTSSLSIRSQNDNNGVIGNNIKYKLDTENNHVFVDFDITLLELNPKITKDLLSFIHQTMLEGRFVNGNDSLPPFSFADLNASCDSQFDVFNKFLDWESDCLFSNLDEISGDIGDGYYVGFKIRPVFINEQYVTYYKYANYCLGGSHDLYYSDLESYYRENGDKVELDDIIKPEAMSRVRALVAAHMASKYSIEEVATVQQYLKSLNNWNGTVHSNPITIENYPIHTPGIHAAGLAFSYRMYELTLGVDGCPKILLTYDELKGCLKPPFDEFSTISPQILERI